MTIKVFYDARQVVPNNASPSPSAGKPALVVEEWKRKGYDFQLGAVTPVTRDKFYLAHDPDFINGVLDLQRDNGFSNRSSKVAVSLPWTTGSLLAAAFEALTTQTFTSSPTSGFHHSGYATADGFCTFNGLMITSIMLRNHLPGLKIGILDLDHHYGNGTDNIIGHLGINYIRHYTFGGDNPGNWHWKGGNEAKTWLKRLPGIVKSFADCDLVIYQAGADPHISDPYGGALTDDQLRLRDRIVFTGLVGKGVTWNLAGGYQTPIQKVLDIHNATMEECLAVMRSR